MSLTDCFYTVCQALSLGVFSGENERYFVRISFSGAGCNLVRVRTPKLKSGLLSLIYPQRICEKISTRTAVDTLGQGSPMQGISGIDYTPGIFTLYFEVLFLPGGACVPYTLYEDFRKGRTGQSLIYPLLIQDQLERTSFLYHLSQ